MELKFILESLLFSAQKPLSPSELREVLANAAAEEDADATVKALKKVKEAELNVALEQLVPLKVQKNVEVACRCTAFPGLAFT